MLQKCSEVKHQKKGGDNLDNKPALILPREAATILGCSERWVHDLADDGKLPIAKEEPYGKKRMRRWFSRTDVETYAAQQRGELM